MKNRLFYFLLALVALAAAIGGSMYWRANYLAGVALINLPVPRGDIPPYTLLKMEMFSLQPFPRALVSDGGEYVQDWSTITGHITTGTLVSGLPIPEQLVVPPEQFRLADPKLEVASIPVDPVHGVGGHVQIGELVNVYRLRRNLVTFEDQGLIVQEDDSTQIFKEQGDAIFVATVPVVAVLADQGTPASTDPDEANPMRMLVVAAPPDVMEGVLEAVAMSELGDELLWVTLATPLP